MSDDLVKLARLAQFDTGADLYGDLSDRIEELEAKLAEAVKERDEALNQLDSARHSVDVLEKRVKTFCDGWGVADKGRIEAETKLAKAVEECACIAESHKPSAALLSDRYWRGVDEAAHSIAYEIYATLAELTGGKDE